MIGPAGVVHRVGVAMQFLTRLPVPGLRFEQGDLRRALGAFPLVGVVVAGLGIGVRAGLEPLLGAVPATVAAVAAMVAATGALHEDGLADAFDGLWGGRTPEDRLEIMRDSRVGTYGAVALVLVLAMELALLAPLTVGAFARATLAGAVLGRASSLPLLRWIAPAPDSSAALAGVPSGAALAVGGTTAVLAAAAAAGPLAWIPLLAAAAVTTVAGLTVRRLLGGINGDVLGATNRLVDVTVIATIVALGR